jgi:hypothetical protein
MRSNNVKFKFQQLHFPFFSNEMKNAKNCIFRELDNSRRIWKIFIRFLGVPSFYHDEAKKNYTIP